MVVDAIVLTSCVPENQLLGVPIETDDGVIVAAASKKQSEQKSTSNPRKETYSTTSRLGPYGTMDMRSSAILKATVAGHSTTWRYTGDWYRRDMQKRKSQIGHQPTKKSSLLQGESRVNPEASGRSEADRSPT